MVAQERLWLRFWHGLTWTFFFIKKNALPQTLHLTSLLLRIGLHLCNAGQVGRYGLRARVFVRSYGFRVPLGLCCLAGVELGARHGGDGRVLRRRRQASGGRKAHGVRVQPAHKLLRHFDFVFALFVKWSRVWANQTRRVMRPLRRLCLPLRILRILRILRTSLSSQSSNEKLQSQSSVQ